MENVKVIGLTGKKGHGKDFIFNCIKKYFEKNNNSNYKVVRIAFADALKQAVQKIFLLSDDQLNDSLLKETPCPELSNFTPRQIMQQLGDFARGINPNVFINIVQDKINKLKFIATDETRLLIVITDVRFDNEAQVIYDQGGKIVLIDASERLDITDSHITERGIDNAYIDFTLKNILDKEMYTEFKSYDFQLLLHKLTLLLSASSVA